MPWEYHREERETENELVPEGRHRVRIKSADFAVSKNGNDMLCLRFDVSGYNTTLYHYIVFMPDKPQITNRNLTQFFDAFPGIPEGELDREKWIGKVGAAQIKHDDYNGKKSAKINWFIPADKQADLPPWKNADGVTEVGPVESGELPEMDLPF